MIRQKPVESKREFQITVLQSVSGQLET
jgi:hypothetical protein